MKAIGRLPDINPHAIRGGIQFGKYSVIPRILLYYPHFKIAILTNLKIKPWTKVSARLTLGPSLWYRNLHASSNQSPSAVRSQFLKCTINKWTDTYSSKPQVRNTSGQRPTDHQMLFCGWYGVAEQLLNNAGFKIKFSEKSKGLQCSSCIDIGCERTMKTNLWTEAQTAFNK